jgi:hypothetical protein
VIGGAPPVEVSVALYPAVLTMPFGSDVVVTTSAAGLILILRFAVDLTLSASFTCTVKLNVPNAVGVPEIAPALLSVKPAGNVLAALTKVQVYGETPPVAARLVVV